MIREVIESGVATPETRSPRWLSDTFGWLHAMGVELPLNIYLTEMPYDHEASTGQRKRFMVLKFVHHYEDDSSRAIVDWSDEQLLLEQLFGIDLERDVA